MNIRFVQDASRWFLRAALWLGLGLLLAAVTAALVFQFWFLPRANDYRQDIADAVRRATGVGIEIGSLSGEWRDWRPHVTLGKVLIRDGRGRDALFIEEIRSEIAWKSIPLLEMRLHSLDVSRLALEVRRDVHGQFFVAGLPLDTAGGTRSGLGDWLLRQDAVRLKESALHWIDEKAGAPPLELTQVSLELRNRFGQHHVTLKATPPIALSAPFEVKADIKGEVLADPADWDGTVEVLMPYINLGEARRYWTAMDNFQQGMGTVDARFEFEGGSVSRARAKVALANLSGKLGPDLEALQLSRLSGGIDISRSLGSLQATLKDLAFTTPDGLTQTGLTGSFERTASQEGVLETTLSLNSVDLGPVVRVANRVPISQAVRARLQAMQPEGRLTRLKFGTREQAGRLTRFNLSTEFASLAMKATDRFPGFSGVSGSVKATEKGGELTLSGRNTQIDLPRIFVAALPLDQLNARLTWQTKGDASDIKILQFDVANRDAAGKVNGTYRYSPGNAGYADITATLSRAEASAVWRYIPRVVPDPVRDWLRKALLAGRSRQANVVVRGALADFPFSQGKPGLFEVTLKAEGGTVDYVTGWPRLEDVSCNLTLRGSRLEITEGSARIFGTAIRNSSVTVPDLNPADPRALIKGEAQGSSADFLRYVNESPLSSLAGEAARQFQVQGEGRLVLSLEIPLKNPETTKADGVFTPVSNRLALPWELGNLEQLSGALRLTEKGISARGMTAQYLGGAVRFDLSPVATGGMEVVANGRASGAGIARLSRTGWDRHLTGSTEWRGRFGLYSDRVDVLVESNLTGLGSDLPAPLNKGAAEALQFRVERRKHDSGLGLLRAQLGERVLVRFLSPLDDWFTVKTGEVVFNGKSGVSEREGLRISGRLAELDLDAWTAALDARQSGQPGTPAPAQALPPITLQGLQVDRLYWYSRSFAGLTLSGRYAPALTQLSIESKSVQGELAWRPQGSGSIAMRMARLYLPPAQAGASALGEKLTSDTLPAIEAEVQDFRLGERELGRLSLSAIPQGRVWQLRQLNLTLPEGNAQMRGMYDLRGRVPRMSVEARVEVSDIGGYFARLRLPQGIKRGKAKLEGNLQWSGAPYSLDLPSLTGRVVLEAKQGQFTKIEPGVGKLLGVLSLQSLPRRLTLDFRDVFSQGFAFSQINASSDISGGVATTQDFKMLGPAAAVEIKGGADMLRETQNLRVRVLPGVSDGLTVAGAIVNPAIGLATYLAQKVFNDPIDKLFASEYDVTGTWVDPQVKKVVSEAAVSKGRR